MQSPLLVKALAILGAAGLAVLSATVLKGTEAGPYVFGLAGTLLGLVLPELGRKVQS
jgi:preprotein translocase subunit Sec63